MESNSAWAKRLHQIFAFGFRTHFDGGNTTKCCQEKCLPTPLDSKEKVQTQTAKTWLLEEEKDLENTAEGM